MTGMDYYKMFADSIEYADKNGKPIEDKVTFIDNELEKESEESAKVDK